MVHFPFPWSTQEKAEDRALAAEFNIGLRNWETITADGAELGAKWCEYVIQTTVVGKDELGHALLFRVRLWRPSSRLWLEAVLPGLSGPPRFETRFAIRGIEQRNHRDELLKLYTARTKLMAVINRSGRPPGKTELSAKQFEELLPRAGAKLREQGRQITRESLAEELRITAPTLDSYFRRFGASYKEWKRGFLRAPQK